MFKEVIIDGTYSVSHGLIVKKFTDIFIELDPAFSNSGLNGYGYHYGTFYGAGL